MNKTTAYTIESILQKISKTELEIREIEKLPKEGCVVVRGDTSLVKLDGKAELDAIVDIIRVSRLEKLKELEERLSNI